MDEIIKKILVGEKNAGEDRFCFNGEKANGYWCIVDNENEDGMIWIDCPGDFIATVVDALNSVFAT